MANDFRSFRKTIAGKKTEIYDYLPTIGSVGDFVQTTGINVLINSIRTLLLTPLGYYPFDPNFGSLLYQKVFDPLDEISRNQIEFEVRQRIEKFDDRVVIEDVIITAVGTDGKAFRVDVFIKRGDVGGTISLHLTGQGNQFGLEDT